MEEEERQRREAEEARLRAEEEERQAALAKAKELEEQLERVSMHKYTISLVIWLACMHNLVMSDYIIQDSAWSLKLYTCVHTI